MKTENLDVILPDDKAKAGTVKHMFGRIAGRYDLMNRLMTFGRDRAWHREVVRRAALPIGGRLLDIGSGTGGIVRAALGKDPGLSAVAADFTFEMMAAGRTQHGSRSIQWCGADALALPFGDNTFDAVTSGYLIRNVVDIRQAFAEQMRVVRPGGKVVCLDTSPPPPGLLHPFITIYLQTIIPLVGRFISGDHYAYRYLPESTRHFHTPAELEIIMQAVGLEKTSYRRLMYKTVVILQGTKPDGFVKSDIRVTLHPSSLRRTVSTPHSAGFASLDLELFTKPSATWLFTGPSNFEPLTHEASPRGCIRR